jgi:hypothetical protein
VSERRKRAVTPKQFWTCPQEAYLRAGYGDTPMGELMAVLCRPATAIQARARVLGLKRGAAFMAGEHGGRLRPGDERSKATRFGSRPVEGRP